MSNPAIEITNLSKRYRLGNVVGFERTFREMLCDTARRIFSSPGKREAQAKNNSEFWALSDVNLTINPGEVVGLIGHNGAGKSTLLKILSRITDPTQGQAILRGRIGSLLEVGTGFHPELTGRENIFLNGAILGMTRREIKKHFDEIVAFAEIDKFLDTPVKRYSSGMFVRLAFAVAAHLEPEILLVDEVLAVGDASFQKKCLGKMRDVAGNGRTVVFVSHNMGAVRTLCDRAVLLNEGSVQLDSTPDLAIEGYMQAANASQPHNGETVWPDDDSAPGGDQLRLQSVRLLGPTGKPQAIFDAKQPISVEIGYKVIKPVRGMRVNLQLLTMEGLIAFTSTDHQYQPQQLDCGQYISSCKIPDKLLNIGAYCLRIGLDLPGVQRLIKPQQGFAFSTIGIGNQNTSLSERWHGVICPQLKWAMQISDKKLSIAG